MEEEGLIFKGNPGNQESERKSSRRLFLVSWLPLKSPKRGIPLAPRIENRQSKFEIKKKVARHSTALEESRYRCCLPALAEFTLLPMHGTWPTRTMPRFLARATPMSGVARVSRPVMDF